MASEVLSKVYNEKIDIWSCGVVLYILLIKNFPFLGKTPKEIVLKVLDNEFDKDNKNYKKLPFLSCQFIDLLL